jgi:regulator of nucleoside diphosphate kinase
MRNEGAIDGGTTAAGDGALSPLIFREDVELCIGLSPCGSVKAGLMNRRSMDMESRDIYITKFDLARLKELLEVGISFKERDREYLESLQNELDRAHIVEPTAIPENVVTMNSQVRLKDMETGEEKS